MMHGLMYIKHAKGFKPEPGRAYNLRGCLSRRACQQPVDEAYMQVVGMTTRHRLNDAISCSTAGLWFACYECLFKYGSINCRKFRSGIVDYKGKPTGRTKDRTKRPIKYRLVYFFKKRMVSLRYERDEWCVRGVWEDGYR